MISFERFVLNNGLRVLHHYDEKTPLAVVNVLYNVGARDEQPELTGMAHLFEHLMFSGSVNASSYDEPLQKASGENNAFTNNDITNYYLTLPAHNIETGLWLESDRMFQLNLNQQSLDVQKNVVIEEFKQRYLNQPYGDVWLELRPLVYHEHPYQWPTIGKEISHIEKVNLEDLKYFYNKFYHPGNAILVIAGNISFEKAKELVTKWFDDIPGGVSNPGIYSQEPLQKEERRKEIKRKVPLDALYMSFQGVERKHPDYYTIDLLTDIFGGSASSRLYNRLVKEKRLFAEISCYQTDSMDKGMLVISGKLHREVSYQEAEKAIWEELEKISRETIEEDELQKVKNKKETILSYSNMDVLSKAMNLASFELLGDAAMINEESGKFNQVTVQDIQRVSQTLFKKEQSSILQYTSQK